MSNTNDLRITLVQSDLHWEDREANLKHLDQHLSRIVEPTDIVVLCEMFTTGFSMQPQKIAEYMLGDTVTWMQQIASEKNTAICGSIII